MKISIPKPCHENWDQMSPAEKGKFCGICSKNVTDIRDMSVLEIENEIGNNPNMCIVADTAQLNGNLEYSFINSLFSKFALGFILTSAGIISVNAQQKDNSNHANSGGNVTHQTPVPKSFTKGKVAYVPPKKEEPRNPRALGMMIAEPASKKAIPLYILDGEIVDEKKVKSMNPKAISKMEVLKAAKAKSIYGEKGKDGAIVITSKK